MLLRMDQLMQVIQHLDTHAGKIPAVSYFTAVPFGPGASEYHGWMEYGGGQQLKDRIYGEYGLKALNCLTHAPETSGWFRKKINNVEELKGMKTFLRSWCYGYE